MGRPARVGVIEAARLLGRHPDTIRRRSRKGKLRASKGRSQQVLAGGEPEQPHLDSGDQPPLPAAWRWTVSGAPMPDVAAAVRRSRAGH